MEDKSRISPTGRSQPIELIIQLMRHIPTLRSSDDALLYIARIMVLHLDIACLQIYALQQYENGQTEPRLRAYACSDSLDPTFLSQSWFTMRTTQASARLMQQKKGINSLPIEKLFSAHHVALLDPQHIHFWSGYLHSAATLLPPITTSSTPAPVATPLTLVFSLFTPHPLSSDLAHTLSFIVNQSLRVMESSGLFSPSKTHQPSPRLSFSQIIPHRIQHVDQLQAANPFTSAIIITDKQARQLYLSIDGHKNLSTIAYSLAIDKNTLLKHLNYLYTQKYITFHDLQGSPIDPSPFL